MLNYLLSGKSSELGPKMMDRLAKFRHRVFIRELGWSLPTVDDLETDEFVPGCIGCNGRSLRPLERRGWTR